MESDSGLLRKSCCRGAYLRGAFQGGGSVNRPEAAYHLELSTGNFAFAQLLCSLLRRMGLDGLVLPAAMQNRELWVARLGRLADKLAIAADARAKGRTAEDAARLVGWSRATLYRHQQAHAARQDSRM